MKPKRTEPLIAWDIANTIGFVFKDVLIDIGRGIVDNYIKTFFNDYAYSGLGLVQQEALVVAFGQALKELLLLVQQELEDAELAEEELQQYSQPLKRFLTHPTVLAELGKPFAKEASLPDTKSLRKIWDELGLSALPDEFNWNVLVKRYRRKVDAIARQSVELREILDSVNLAKGVSATVSPASELDLRRYQQAIQKTYGYLRLDSFETTGYNYGLKLWQVFIEQNVRQVQEFLPEVYELPKYHQQRLRESNQLEETEILPEELERYKQAYAQQSAVGVLDVVKDSGIYPRLVLLGDPGSGKSSLVQYLTLTWATASIEVARSQPIPLLIELRNYMRDRNSNQCENLLDFFDRGSGFIYKLGRHQLQEILQAGKAFVMFDGLDEVFDPICREQAVTDIINFTTTYPQVRVLVTSRVIGYKQQRLREAKFHHFMLQDLEPEQIEEFINRWHDLAFDQEAEKVKKRDRLKRAIEDSLAIKELAGNPLLLTMMAILNRHQELPRDRPELYSQSSRVLLQQWDVEKALHDTSFEFVTVDYKDKQAMLRQVAYQMQAGQKGLTGNLIEADKLKTTLANYLDVLRVRDSEQVAELMIEQLRSRNFILCFLGADYYAFVHRTFLEYFCAWEFVWQFEKERSITLEDLKTDVFGKHWQDESWNEVLRLIAGMIDAKFVGEILEYLLEQKNTDEKFTNIFLAADCLSEVRNRMVLASTAAKLFKQLEGLISYGSIISRLRSSRDVEDNNRVTKIRTHSVAAVATTWKDDPDTLPILKQWAISDDNSAVRQAAVEELARGWKDDPDTLAILKQRATADDAPVVRRAAVQELARGWKDDPDTLAILKQRVTADDNWAVRRAAVQELARGWKDDPDTLPILKQRVTADDDEDVRQAAVQELARGWKDDPDTLAILKQRVTADDHPVVRQAAVQGLARGWKNDPDTLPILKQWATADDNNLAVRRAAVQELARGWKDDPDTLAILKQRVTADDHPAVRGAAVEELARGWKDDPDTLPILKQWAISDDNWAVQQAAVQELARGWKNDPDTLAILKQRATADDHPVVRQAAVGELVRGWKDDPDTLAILKQRATADDDEDVRQAAVEELARGWKDDPDTLAILKQWAISDDNSAVRQAAVQGLARGWKDDPDTLAILKQRATADDSEDVRGAAVEELARGWKDDPDTLAILKQWAISDDNWAVRRAAVQELARGWKDDPDTLVILKQRATADDSEDVRGAAVQELARGWKDDPDTLPILKQRVTADDHPAVRGAAVQELACGWKDDPDTLPILKQWATADDNSAVRQAAVQELARGWKDDPDTLPILKQRATADDNSAVRRAAVQELARGWKDDPDTLPILKQRVTADDHPVVRQAAVQGLARGWKDDPDTLAILKQRVTADDHPVVRQAAVQGLARDWKDDPDTLPILKQRATADDHPVVRQAAVQGLARGWKDEPWMFEFLCDRAVNDPFERKEDREDNPRRLALEIIITQYPNHPQTPPLLQDRAENDPDEKLREFAKRVNNSKRWLQGLPHLNLLL
jgi:predicted NACHT family NTPase